MAGTAKFVQTFRANRQVGAVVVTQKLFHKDTKKPYKTRTTLCNTATHAMSFAWGGRPGAKLEKGVLRITYASGDWKEITFKMDGVLLGTDALVPAVKRAVELYRARRKTEHQFNKRDATA